MCKLVYNKYSSDKKDVSILLSFLIWLILGFCIIFVGVNNVFASTYNTNYELVQQYYDNRGSSLTNINTSWNESLQSYVSDNITTVANSYGAGVSLTSPIPLIKNHTYSISFYFIDRNNIALSIKNKVTVGTSIADAKVNYAKDTYYADTIYSKITNNSILQFVFKAGQNGNSIFIPWTTTTNVTQSYVFTEIIMEDLGSEGISQEDINNSLNNQTNELNNSIQNSTNTITGEIDDMEQSIIDSNKETQDVIKDQFNTCRDSYNLLNVPYDYSVNGVHIYDMVLEPGTYTIKADEILVGGTDGRTATIFFYEGDTYTAVYLTNDIKKKSFNITEEVYRVRIYSSNNYTNSQGVTTTYKGLMLAKGFYNGKYEAYGEEICSNKLDETNNQLGDLNNSLNNSDSSGATNDASNFFSNFTTDTFGLTSIITAPLSLINNLTSSSCSTLRLPLPYLDNKYLELPCMETIYTNYFGLFFAIYQTITFGIVSYWVIVRIFNQVKDFKNPDHDEIEVLDL